MIFGKKGVGQGEVRQEIIFIINLIFYVFFYVFVLIDKIFNVKEVGKKIVGFFIIEMVQNFKVFLNSQKLVLEVDLFL